MITLDLHPTLSQYGKNIADTMQCAKGSSIGDLLEQLGIPPEIGLIIILNGSIVSKATILQGEESLKIMPLMGGG